MHQLFVGLQKTSEPPRAKRLSQVYLMDPEKRALSTASDVAPWILSAMQGEGAVYVGLCHACVHSACPRICSSAVSGTPALRSY